MLSVREASVFIFARMSAPAKAWASVDASQKELCCRRVVRDDVLGVCLCGVAV